VAKTNNELVLVDSNVLIDVIHADPVWAEWSAAQLERLSDLHELVINPIIYAEVSAYYQSRREADMALSESDYRRLPLPYEAAFEAGQAFREYRRRGGARSMPLPDFFIGAHAKVSSLTLLTRDTRRYRTYFPDIKLIAPDPPAEQ
jgi:Predicted nucleic acid-binding protein, contains PIN domain